MGNRNEYELISYPKIQHIKIGFVEISFRNLHIHKEFEIGLVLKGRVVITCNSQQYQLNTGEMFIFNPNEAHELAATGNGAVRIVFIQLSRNFCDEYIHLLRHIVFDRHIIRAESYPIEFVSIRSAMIETVRHYISHEDLSYVRCMRHLFDLIDVMLRVLPHHKLSIQDYSYDKKNADRIEAILEIIETRCNEKLSLSEIAAAEHVTTGYLSHFIHKYSGRTFQELVTGARLKKAAVLLVKTNMRAIDICLESGFSDPKYLNRAFMEYFGCTPMEFRATNSGHDTFQPARSPDQTYANEQLGLSWINELTQKLKNEEIS